MKPRAFVFDAYGTLFDVHSVVARAANLPGDLQALSGLWRQKQLEYTWLRSLMERYQDFWDVTEAALRAAVTQLKIQASDAEAGLPPAVGISGRDKGFGRSAGRPIGHPFQRFAQDA